LRFNEFINLEISYKSVGAKNILNSDLFFIKLSAENFDGAILFANSVPMFVKKLQNSLAIVCGSLVGMLLILNVSDIPVLSFVRPISELMTPQILRMSYRYFGHPGISYYVRGRYHNCFLFHFIIYIYFTELL
jgi:hypothetical protein